MSVKVVEKPTKEVDKQPVAKEKDALDLAIDTLNKRYGKGAVLTGDETVITERIGTGSLGLDLITGGGYGIGRIVELFGPESSGKTTLCIHAMVEAQKNFPNKKVAVVDTEHAFDKTYAESLGLKMDEVIISQPSSGEEALEIAETLIRTGKLSICLIDSVAALTPQKEIDGEMGDSNMGLHARLMSQACKKLTGPVSKTGTVLFFTNQMRLKIGLVFGDPRTTTGGEALKFYASMRIELSKKQGEKDGDEVLTSHVTCKTVKNKLAPPFRKCEFEIRFGEGIDRLGEILELAVNCGIIKKTGSWYSYGETKLGQGSVGVKELLKDNKELAQEIEDNVMEAYNF